MGRKNRSKGREGKVVTVRAGERWTAQLELDVRSGDHLSHLRVDVPGMFLSQAAADRAAQAVLNDWRVGHVTLRDLVLRELAAAYRQLRATHKAMEPVAVPTTSAAWIRAIDLWELAGWLDAAEAARYHDHAERAFDVAAVKVKRHGLVDARTDPTS
jgi:hypothetical protein